MEAAIVSALIAGSISLIGFLVTLRIVRQTRLSSERLPTLQSAAKLLEERLGSLKAMVAEGEKLRLRAWDLIGGLSVVNYNRLFAKTDLDFINKNWDAFADQDRAFLNSWAEAKADIPDGIFLYMKILRHECRDISRDIAEHIKTLSAHAEHFHRRKFYFAETEDQLRALQEECETFNRKLDELLTIAINLRSKYLAEGTR